MGMAAAPQRAVRSQHELFCTWSSSQHKQWAGLMRRHAAVRAAHVVALAGKGSNKVSRRGRQLALMCGQ